MVNNKEVETMKVQFPFTNDFVFGKVMYDNPEIVKEVIRRATGNLLKGINLEKAEIHKQETVDTSKESKGIRFDVFMKTDEAIFDLEMQTKKKRDLVERARYYLSVNDTEMLKKGDMYKKLPKSIIIFICTFDPFGYCYGKYVAEERLIGDDKTGRTDLTEDVGYDGGYAKIYLTTEGLEDLDEDLRNFLMYVAYKKPTDEFTKEVDKKVAEVNKNNRETIMTLEDKYRECKEEGLEEGRAEGLEEGRTEGLKAIINSLRPYISNVDDMYKAVVANKSYSDVSFEIVKSIYEKS